MLTLLCWVALFFLCYSILPTLICKRRFSRAKNRKLYEKKLFLTFDDGPSKEYTEKLLDVLKKNGIKATFFVVAEYAKANKQIVKRMKLDGHTIGLHSYRHQSALLRGYCFMKKDFRVSVEALKELGCRTVFYRPPWGQLNLLTFLYLKKYNLQLVLWDVMAQDWKSTITSEEIEKRILYRIKEGSVICLHDGRGASGAPERTVEALSRAIPLLRKRGYHFLNLEEGYDATLAKHN